jgi:hypothetical protein
MGMTLADLPGPYDEVSPSMYQTAAVPMPHAAFESYVLQITPNLGLAWAKGIGRSIQTGGYGIELKSAFDDMERRLSAVYGSGQRTDVLLAGSIWNEPHDFMMGLVSHERYLMTEWSRGSGSAMREPVDTVGLIANAFDANTGYLALEYYFENADAATAEVARLEDQAL